NCLELPNKLSVKSLATFVSEQPLKNPSDEDMTKLMVDALSAYPPYKSAINADFNHPSKTIMAPRRVDKLAHPPIYPHRSCKNSPKPLDFAPISNSLHQKAGEQNEAKKT